MAQNPGLSRKLFRARCFVSQSQAGVETLLPGSINEHYLIISIYRKTMTHIHNILLSCISLRENGKRHMSWWIGCSLSSLPRNENEPLGGLWRNDNRTVAVTHFHQAVQIDV